MTSSMSILCPKVVLKALEHTFVDVRGVKDLEELVRA